MKPRAAIALIEQSLALHKSGGIDEGDFLSMVYVTLTNVADAPAEPPGTRPLTAMEIGMDDHIVRGSVDAGGREGHAPQPNRLGNAVRRFFKPDREVAAETGHAAPDAPIDIDAPDTATAAILRASLKDYAEGKIDRDEMQGYAERRGEEIRQMRRDARSPAAQPRCATCGAPADTAIGREHYCPAHIDAARPARPIVAVAS